MDDIGQPAISREELYTAAVGERGARYYVPKFLAFEGETKEPTTLVTSVVSALYVGIILPVFANYLYYSSVGRRITHLREKFADDADALRVLKSRSPVSWVAPTVLALLIVAGRLLPISISQNQASDAYVRAAMEQTALLRTAVVKSYLSRHVWPEDLQDLSREGEVPPFLQNAENLRVDLGTITVRFTSVQGLRGGLLSFRPSLSSTGAVVWTCGYHSPAGVDVHNAGAGPDLTNIAPRYLPTECKKHFWDRN